MSSVTTDLRKAQSRYEIIARLGLIAGRTHDVGQFQQQCVEEIAAALHAEHAAYIELVDAETVACRAAIGWGDTWQNSTVPLDKCGQMGFALETKSPVLVHDFALENRFVVHDIVTRLNLRSGMTAIAFENLQPLGIVAVHSAAPGRFDDDDLAFLQAVTNMIGSAVARARALEALAEREESFRTLCQMVPIVIWAAEPSGRIDFYNREWFKYCSVDNHEELSARRHEFLHPDDVEHVERIWGEGLRSGRHFDVEYRWRRDKDSAYVWLRSIGVPVYDSQGALRRWIGTTSDISAERQLAEVLESMVAERTAELEASCEMLAREKQKREQAVEELQRLTYVLSHELQAPVRLILSQLGLLAVRYREKLGPDADEFIEASVRASKAIGNMIDDLWMFSRIEAMGSDRTAVDTTALVDKILAEREVEVRAASASVSHQALPVVHANDKQLEYLFKQLLDNALKFRSHRPLKVRVHARMQDHEWVFAVEDNGMGFDMMASGQIFNMFKRLLPQKVEGSGMGLAICRRIVESHDGRIWASSVPDEGSTFYFSLPAAD